MAPLLLLLISFFIFWALNKLVLDNRFTISFIGRTSLALMLLLTSTAHFSNAPAMVQMMPAFLPFKVQLVYFTGILEIAVAIGLWINRTTKMASIVLIVFFILILPSNVIGSLKRVELGGMENGPIYLFFRIPLQFLFTWWAYYFGIRKFERKN
jgi:uncharacterized membrane protein